MEFYFGTQGDLRSVKVPSTGLERLRSRYRSSGVLTNGGGWTRQSIASHNVYTINWDFIRNAQYASIAEVFEYGDLIHFLDPQAAVSNALPPYVAQAGDAARGGYRMVGYSSTATISEISTLAPEVLTGPKRTARYASIATAARKQIWLPVPTGYTLWLRGLTSGAARISLSNPTNLLASPRLDGLSMSINGSTSVDTFPTTGGPDNGSYFRRTVSVANTTSPMSMPLSGAGTAGTPVAPNTPYVTSWYARKSAGGPAIRVDVAWYDAAGTIIGSTSSGPNNSPGTGWGRYSRPLTSPAGAAFMRATLSWTGTAAAGQTLDLAMAQIEVGTTPTAFTESQLPVYAGGGVVPQVSVISGISQGTYITIGAGDNIDIRWLQALVLPTGQTPVWSTWMPGLGHSGCRPDGDPSYTLYSAPQAIDFGALSLPLRETGAWE